MVTSAGLARGFYAELTPLEYQFGSDPAMRDAECVARVIADTLDPLSDSRAGR